MKFKRISIRNFRNFENIDISLDNKNIFFGMNDIGKTNFLYALRFIFDKTVRKNNLIDTDFYEKNIGAEIEIIVQIDISDTDDADSEKLRAKVKGALLSSQDSIYIKLVASYDPVEMEANPILYWGGSLNDLQEIKARGSSFEIDTIFSVIYIDAYVDLYALFKKNISLLLKDNEAIDENTFKKIKGNINKLNKNISSLSGIKNFERKIMPSYERYRDESVEIVVKSEISINGLYSSVTPYIKDCKSNKLYPTSGEGRKKLLSYSLYDVLAQDIQERKIVLFLIEEPENNLHKTLQIALSHELFENENYKYTFMTTHSSYILQAMDNVNLIRIFNRNRISSKSVFYQIPTEYYEQRQRLNKEIGEAIFANKVLLVEGQSEEVLFEKILYSQDPLYLLKGIYILVVNGIDFQPYIKILSKLGITYFIKTDNDLRRNNENKFTPIGFMRINAIIGEETLPVACIDGNTMQDKRNLYKKSKKKLNQIRKEEHIFLSKVSLEEDLDEVLGPRVSEICSEANGNLVSYLKEQKKYNMINLVKNLEEQDCKAIFNHYNFACLKEVLK